MPAPRRPRIEEVPALAVVLTRAFFDDPLFVYLFPDPRLRRDDLPAYFAWQQHPPAQRRADLMRWTDTLAPLSVALHVLLGLLRESGVPHKVIANGGQYQQSLPTARTYHLLRVKLPLEADLVPEISGHRLMVSIRLMKADPEGRLRPLADDCAFELALCA